jgi:hypothetical protein
MLAALTVPALSCGAASSQTLDGGLVINGQVQLGDVLSTQILSVEEAVDGVTMTTDATGNAVVANRNNGPVVFDSGQTLGGYAAATSSVYVADRVRKPYDVLTTATGNTASVSVRGGQALGESTQVISEGGGTLAAAYDGVDGPAKGAVIEANAVGNTQGWAALRGRIGSTTHQINAGVTEAKSEAEFWRASELELTAVAAANNVTADAAQSDLDMAVTQTTGDEPTRALADSHVYDVGVVSGYAEASGNSIDAVADGGNAGLVSTQTNNGRVVAEAQTSAKFFDYGEAVAYGVGNSASLANVGPKTEVLNRQVNNADVLARATFSGQSGNDVAATANAYGNIVSGFSCTDCGGELYADSAQRNEGGVQAVTSTTLGRGRARSVNNAAAATGNSATFLVQSAK